MRSIFLVLSACGAVSYASECQASEETSLLQGRSRVRLTTDAKSSSKSSLTEGSDAKSLDARGLVKSLQNLAHKVGTISDEEVNQALAEAADALATLSPAIQEEVQALQNTIRDAAAAVQACHAESGVAQRAGLWEAAEAQAAEVTTCEAELATAVADEERICSAASVEDVQSECACNEARTRREDKHELCEALTTAYENAYCEHNLQCNTYHDCHEGEIVVYNQIRADVEAAMGPINQEYIAAEQSTCIMEIIQHSMMNGVPIDFAAVLACSNVDTSSLLMVYPDLPAAPGACPAPTTGSPGCVAAAPEGPDCRLSAYWEYGNCGCGGNDQNQAWCNGIGGGDCPDTVETDICSGGTAYLAEWHPKPYTTAGHQPGHAGHLVRDGCEYIWHAQYACQEPEFDCRLSAYWEYGNGGCGGNDQNQAWCGGIRSGDCPDTIETSICPSGTAYLAVFHPKPYSGAGHRGRGTAAHYHRDGVEYIWHAQYACN